MIRVAIQTKGRLNEESLSLLRDSGLNLELSKRKLISKCSDFPLEILYLRDDDIPNAVSSGIADIGIVGYNEVLEKGSDLVIDKKLSFGKCRLSLAIPKTDLYCGLEYFNNKRVATSYPNILERYFKERGVSAKIHQIAGSVEIAPSVGMSDAIFDIVGTGATLISNGLKEVEVVLESQAVIVANNELSFEKRKIVDQLIVRVEAVERSRGMKYLLINLPDNMIDKASSIVPGLRSPTILPLSQKGWCSMHVAVSENGLWPKLEELKAIGAEGILVLSLDKILP